MIQKWSGSDAAAVSAGLTLPVQSGPATTWSCWQADVGAQSRLTRWWPDVTVLIRCISTIEDVVSPLASVHATTKPAAKLFHLEGLYDATAPYGRRSRSTFPFHWQRYCKTERNKYASYPDWRISLYTCRSPRLYSQWWLTRGSVVTGQFVTTGSRLSNALPTFFTFWP